MSGETNRIDKIAKLIDNYKFNQIIVIGHTADIGRAKNQQILSENRAKAIVSYFVEKHKYNSSFISFIGRGGEEPIADNTTAEGRAKNRRVEIIVLP